MIPIPSPLHPAVVHFPIALLLVGCVAAFAAVFIRRWHLSWLAALLLVFGAAGAVVAVGTGEQEEEIVDTTSAAAEQILDEHEEWGETTRNLALAAAVFALAAAFASKVRLAGVALSVVAALLAFASAYAVAQAGHYGGDLVYRHGVGINTAAGNNAEGAGQERAPHGEEDRD